MKCDNCGKDLMLAIEPEGMARITRLWPFSSYRCVRCGKKTLGLSPVYQSIGARIFLLLLIFGALGAVAWYAGLGKPGHGPALNATLQSKAALKRERQKPVFVPKHPAPVSETALSAVPGNNTASGSDEEPLEEVVLARSGRKVSSAPDETLTALQETLRKAYVKSGGSKSSPGTARKSSRSALNKSSPLKPGVGRIKAVQALATDTELVVSVVADRPLRTYTSFSLKQPPRFVIDVPGAWEYLGQKEIPVHAFGVQKMRVGVHRDKMRIVLDLTAEKSKDPVIKPSPQGLFLMVE